MGRLFALLLVLAVLAASIAWPIAGAAVFVLFVLLPFLCPGAGLPFTLLWDALEVLVCGYGAGAGVGR